MNLGQYGRTRCKPVDGVLVVLSSNQLNIAVMIHQMRDVCISILVNSQYPIYWFASKYSRSAISAQLLYFLKMLCKKTTLNVKYEK